MEEFDKPNIRRLSLTGAKWELFYDFCAAYPAIPHHKSRCGTPFLLYTVSIIILNFAFYYESRLHEYQMYLAQYVSRRTLWIEINVFYLVL